MSGWRASFTACLLTLIALSTAPASAWGPGDTNITAPQGVAAGRDAIGNTINNGFTAEQVQAIVIPLSQQLGVASEARAKAEAEAARLATQLGFTREAVIGFFRILGEQEVPLEQMQAKLVEIAGRYQALLTQLENTSSVDPKAQQLKEEARAALDVGDFARTEELLNQAKDLDLSAIEQMEAAIERMQAARDARKLSAADAAAGNGTLMMTQLRYGDAVRYYAEAVELTPEQHADLLSDRLTGWGEAAWRAGDYHPALEAVRRALALEETRQPTDANRLGRSLNNLAVMLQELGRYDQAEPLLERAIAIGEKTLGPEHPEFAIWLNSLANLYRRIGRYDQAEPLLERAIAIGEKTLGPEHPEFAIWLSNLGLLYEETDRYTEAEPLYKRALTIFEKTRPKHPSLAIQFNNLANLYRKIGRYAEAEPLFKRAIALDEEVLGPEHPGLAMDLSNLAGFYRATGRYAEVEPLYKRAIAIDEKALGPEHIDLAPKLNNLARFYRATGRYAEAEPLYRRALTILDKTLPADHPNVAIVRENYAVLLDQLGRTDEAAMLRARAEPGGQPRHAPPRP